MNARPSWPSTWIAVILLAIALGFAGCADPYANPPSRTVPSPQSGTESDTAPAKIAAPTGIPASDSARDVLAAYAVAYATWTWRTARQQLALRQSLAGGPLARDLAHSARQVATGRWAEQRMTNRGRLVATDARRDGSLVRAVVVLAERAGSDGREEAADRHVVYRAAARRSGHRWRVTSFIQLP